MLNIKPNDIKYLAGEKRSKFSWSIQRFLRIQKALTVKEKTDELDLIKITYCLQKIIKKIIKPNNRRKY